MGSAQNFKPGDLSGVYMTSFSVGQNPLTLLPGQEFTAAIRANTNTWDNLRLTGLHTKDQQINAKVEITGYTYRAVGLTEAVYAPLAIAGPIYSLFRAIPAAVVSAVAVPGGYSTQVIAPSVMTSAYTFTAYGMPTERITLRNVNIDWATAGLQPTGSQLPYTFYLTNPLNPSSLGDMVANGSSDILVDHGQIIGAPIRYPGANFVGVDVLTGAANNLTLSAAFGTASAFSIPLGTGVRAITSMLVGCEWGDGTREGLPCDPFVPVKGHIVVN